MITLLHNGSTIFSSFRISNFKNKVQNFGCSPLVLHSKEIHMPWSTYPRAVKLPEILSLFATCRGKTNCQQVCLIHYPSQCTQSKVRDFNVSLRIQKQVIWLHDRVQEKNEFKQLILGKSRKSVEDGSCVTLRSLWQTPLLWQQSTASINCWKSFLASFSFNFPT